MIRMRATQGVSFPRSGHAIVYQISKRYFGESFCYCDANNAKHCGCGQVPCSQPARTFAKHHDFGLRTGPGTPVLNNERYLVQYRNPVRSITSNYKLHLVGHPEDHHRAGWEKFAFRDLFHWAHLIDKWVLDYPDSALPPFYCTYESILANPQERLEQIIRFMSEDELDSERLDAALVRFPVAVRDNLSAFEFYDEGFFREMEARVVDRLEHLDLPSFTEGY